MPKKYPLTKPFEKWGTKILFIFHNLYSIIRPPPQHPPLSLSLSLKIMNVTSILNESTTSIYFFQAPSTSLTIKIHTKLQITLVVVKIHPKLHNFVIKIYPKFHHLW